MSLAAGKPRTHRTGDNALDRVDQQIKFLPCAGARSSP
jgi:hypothetical protein